MKRGHWAFGYLGGLAFAIVWHREMYPSDVWDRIRALMKAFSVGVARGPVAASGIVSARASRPSADTLFSMYMHTLIIPGSYLFELSGSFHQIS
jgi:hypothetical protein